MRLVVFSCLLFFCATGFVHAEPLTIALDRESVDITTGFTGAHLKVFGKKGSAQNVALILKGPERRMRVRKKEQIAGSWVNKTSAVFQGVPAYYNYAVFVHGQGDPELMLEQEGIGLRHLEFLSSTKMRAHYSLSDFHDALIRNKQSEGLFAAEPAEIEFLADDFFKASFYLPANVPTGLYTLSGISWDGSRVFRQEKKINVQQVGISASIQRLAQNHALFYGLFCVVLALFAGWFSNWMLR